MTKLSALALTATAFTTMLIADGASAATRQKLSAATVYHKAPLPTVYHNVPDTPTVYHGGTGPVVKGFGSTVYHNVPDTPTVYHGGTDPVVKGFGSTATSAGIPPKPVVGTITGATSGSTQTSGGIIGKLNGGVGIVAKCILAQCNSTPPTPPAPTPPPGGGNPPEHGGDHDGDHDGHHDGYGWYGSYHERPEIVVESVPGEVAVPSPMAVAPVMAPPVVAARAPAVAPQVVQAPCDCLTKQKLADGSVLFQDICTKETAIAAPQAANAQ